MVVGVEEGQRFLFQDQEDGVNEFEVFGKIVHLHIIINRLLGP